MKRRKIKRERLEETPRRKIKRERLVVCEPATATFTELMQGIASTSPDTRHHAARRLAAHCAVVFREPS